MGSVVWRSVAKECCGEVLWSSVVEKCCGEVLQGRVVKECCGEVSWPSVAPKGRGVACDRNFWSLVTAIFGRL